jgi:hypothetical protein
MSCPDGQFYSDLAKRCLPNKMRALSKGHSLMPCPEGQVWNPLPNVRKCVRKDIYKVMFGAERAAAASLEQKRLRGSIKAVAKPKSIKKKTMKASSISSSLKKSVTLVSLAPAKDSVMAPGLSRKDMASWVSANCKNQEDPIMLEPYAEADLKDLRSLVRLGSGFCYTAEVLDQHVRASIERDVPIKDMLNPSYRLDGHDFGALKKASKKGYVLPSEPTVKPAPYFKLFIGIAGDPLYKLIFLFDERKVKVSAGGEKEFTAAIPEGGWIGYIPAKGTTKLEKLIKEAFSRGRIFTKASVPFKCCRVHLKKEKAYWIDESARKIKAMEEELQGVL